MNNGKAKKILIVEDEIVAALSETVMLKKNGYEVQAVSSGEQAVETVKKSDRFDLVLIDLNLGSGINGAETSRRILDIMDIPVIFLTSHTGKDIVEQVKSITRYGYVIKGSGEYLLISSIEMAIELFQSRKKIEASEANFQQLTESMNEIFWLRDIKNDSIIYVSPAYEKIWGRSCQSFYDNPWSFSEIIHPDDRERIIKIHEDMRLNHGSSEYEYRIIRDEGDIRWIRARSNPVYDKNNNVFRYAGIAEDVTPQKSAADTLKKRESLLNKIYEILPVGLWIADGSGKLLSANPAGKKIWGKEPHVDQSEYGIFKARRLPSGDEIAPEDWALSRTINEGTTITDELLEIDAFDGEKRVILNYTAPIFGDDNKIEAAIIVNHDITERKRAEDELIETNRQLEAAVERAHEFAVAAESANIAKTQFLANMSHEIRTPLNGIIGLTSLLLDSGVTDQQKKFVEILRSSGDNLLAIINQILDLSKIESHKFELEVRNFNLHTALYDVIEMLALKAGKKNLKFNFKIADAVPCSLSGDSGRLRQIITNLAYNAIKFTDEGRIDVGITVAEESETDVRLRFEISDTGVGIPESHISRLFIPFTQVEGGMNRRYGGTGLGLAISKKIVELMGGEIGVESGSEGGSLFWFTVHFMKPDKPGSAVSTVIQRNSSDKKSGSVEILLVEDNKTNQFVANSILKKLGYSTDLAANGYECIEALKKKEYSLVLMDCQMPGLDGFQTTGEIRSGNSGVLNPGTLIIALTAHALNGDRDKCIQAGMNDYIAKPIKISEIDELLKRWLSTDRNNTGQWGGV